MSYYVMLLLLWEAQDLSQDVSDGNLSHEYSLTEMHQIVKCRVLKIFLFKITHCLSNVLFKCPILYPYYMLYVIL